jgi:hypothetical protein
MAIDLNEIELSPEQKQIIAERATQNGKPWQTILQEAIAPSTESAAKPANGTPQPVEKRASAQPPPGLDEDTEFLALCMEELEELNKKLGSKPVTHERLREILSKVPGSMSDDIIADRGDR